MANAIEDDLKKHHQRQSILCDKLEALADRLPNQVDPQNCLTLARTIFPIVRQAHQFEETRLFPLLQNAATSADDLTQSLERLRFEHWEDESFAEELSDSLLEFGSGRGDGEKLAYMLRGFFEGLRRHMAFETEHLLPLLKGDLTAGSAFAGTA
ncbi:MAG: hemerythrin domain-containing protein [Pseudomonadota bacterium]